MYSTPKDLLTFDQAVFNHTIIKKSTLDVMLTLNKELGDVALGLWVYPKSLAPSIHYLQNVREKAMDTVPIGYIWLIKIFH